MKNHQSNTEPDVPATAEWRTPARLLNGQAGSSLILVCEHASNHIPEHLNALGLPPELQDSHIAWDPGAIAVAENLSRRLDARLVASTVSRLVYDCNRPPEALDAMPVRSEIYDIPGNADLNEADRAERARTYYLPFDSLLSQTIAATPREPAKPVLITIHSFTPVYRGQRRTTEIGILHDSDARLADAILKLSAEHSPLIFRRNDPYGPIDGVTHTLKRHGIRNGLMNVMLEIRNDLIASANQQRTIATMLAGLLLQALTSLLQEKIQEGVRERAQKRARKSVRKKPGEARPGSENGGPECHL